MGVQLSFVRKRGFHNTVGLKDGDLIKAIETCRSQDGTILQFMLNNHTQAWTAHEIWERTGKSILITSIRRSLNSLEGLYIYKTRGSKMERYGKPNYLWKAIKPITK